MFQKIAQQIVSIKPEDKEFIESVIMSMESYFGADSRRIRHAHSVAGYARELLAFIDADPVLTMTVAYLHDIGIHEAERQHGSSAGNFQELEGPPVARRILEELRASMSFIEAVTRIVGLHHTPFGVDSPEFRILWDADALVNFEEIFPEKDDGEIDRVIRRHMVTEPGLRTALRRYLGAR